MKRFSLESMIKSAGHRMREDLSEQLVSHPVELGIGREEIIRRFLRAYLPARFDVSTGFVFDAQGNVSHQLDIIVTNALVCPRFETAGGNRFYPCESVVAVGQVKSSLTSVRELKGALKNLESVKALDRSAAGKAFDFGYCESIDHVNNYLHQIFTFLLVTGDALKAGTMHQNLMDYTLSTAPHLWTNIVMAIDRYLVTFCCDGGICPNPMDARGLALQSASREDEILMKFYLLLGQAIEVTRVSALPYWEYLSAANVWSAQVQYVPSEGSPPYLRSVSSG